jgi:hypothetical protein
MNGALSLSTIFCRFGIHGRMVVGWMANASAVMIVGRETIAGIERSVVSSFLPQSKNPQKSSPAPPLVGQKSVQQTGVARLGCTEKTEIQSPRHRSKNQWLSVQQVATPDV